MVEQGNPFQCYGVIRIQFFSSKSGKKLCHKNRKYNLGASLEAEMLDNLKYYMSARP